MLIINNSKFIVQETPWRWDWVAQRSVGGSRKAVATHGHEAPAAKWCTIITELTVGWLLVKLLGTQQPAPRVVYSTIRATARINTQWRAQKALAQKPAINTASCPFPLGHCHKSLCTNSTTHLTSGHCPQLWSFHCTCVTSEAKKKEHISAEVLQWRGSNFRLVSGLMYVLPVLSWWWTPSRGSFLGLLVYCLQRTT